MARVLILSIILAITIFMVSTSPAPQFPNPPSGGIPSYPPSGTTLPSFNCAPGQCDSCNATCNEIYSNPAIKPINDQGKVCDQFYQRCVAAGNGATSG